RGAERLAGVRVGMVAGDVEATVLCRGTDPIQGTRRDVVGSDGPAPLGEPDRVAALARPDVERASGAGAVDFRDERAVGVAAPHLFPRVTVVPVGFVTRRAGSGPDVVVREAETDRGTDPAALGGCLCESLVRIG